MRFWLAFSTPACGNNGAQAAARPESFRAGYRFPDQRGQVFPAFRNSRISNHMKSKGISEVTAIRISHYYHAFIALQRSFTVHA
jgi:hypothetical protein